MADEKPYIPTPKYLNNIPSPSSDALQQPMVKLGNLWTENPIGPVAVLNFLSQEFPETMGKISHALEVTKDALGNAAHVAAEATIGKTAIEYVKEGVKLDFEQGREAEGTLLAFEGVSKGLVHALTIPNRIIDAGLEATGLIQSAKEVSKILPPEPTPQPEWVKEFNKISGPKA